MEDETHKFQKLTPIDNIELGIYKNAMNYIFEHNDIRNVAITGAYSAGKSSILASYKKQSGLKFIHISLAHFCSFTGENDRDVTEAILERKIINQLIQHIDVNKIPQTNFKVKRRVKRRVVLAQTIMILVAYIAFLHFRNFNIWSDYLSVLKFFHERDSYGFLDFTVDPYSKMVSGGLLIILGGILIYLIINNLKNNNILKKIKLKTYEIDLFDKAEESYFDKYLNDVIYLFENTNANAIVFEDIDRFEINGIFERLREVNSLVNIRLEKEKKDSLRFFYLLRDDIFQSKERTKFFDYIVPIVPIMDSSNSYDELIKHFDQGEILGLFDEKFLQDISLYIDDMRLLKNIYNEFIIYNCKLNITELNHNKMLAIIVYKNLFPQDFGDLQLNKGMIHHLFARKSYFIADGIKELQEKLVKKQKEIEAMDNEHLQKLDELNFLSRHLRINDLESRRKNLENKLNNRREQFEDEIRKIEKEILLLNNKTLSQLITRENEERIFSTSFTDELGIKKDFTSVKGNDYFSLLKYLIRNGYIDETYADYMTYFNEKSISRQDKVFLRSITDRISKDYMYELKNPEKIIPRLRIVDFDQIEILNFDLLEYLLKTPENIQYLNRFLLQLRMTKNIVFIKKFMESQKETLLFVKHLNLQWPDLFSTLLEEEQLPPSLIKLYSLYTIYSLDSESLELVNKNNILSNYISGCEDYLNIENPNIEKLIAGFKLLRISFKDIDYNTANKDLFNNVYQNSLYEINFNLVKLILEEVYKIECCEDIFDRNYTSILSQPNSPLAQYIQQNMNSYIECVLLKMQSGINDDETKIMLILNDDSIEFGNKQKYIQKLKTFVTRIEDITDKSLWKDLIERNLVRYSEDNVIEYFLFTESMDNCLIEWINRNEATLDFSRIENKYDEQEYDKFFESFTSSEGVIDNKYKILVSTFGWYYPLFNIRNLSNNKIKILIDEGIIEMNLKNLDFIRETYPRAVMYFIEKNLNLYVDLINNDSFNMTELLEILSWEIEDEIKLKLLQFTDASISIVNAKYSDTINEYILTNNLEDNDLSHLFKTYHCWDSKTKKIIRLKAEERITDIIEDIEDVSSELISAILVSGKIDYEEKILVLIGVLPSIDKDQCKKYISLLDLPEYRKIFERRTRPKIEIDEINDILLNSFKDRGWIEGFEENNGYYKITKKISPNNKN